MSAGLDAMDESAPVQPGGSAAPAVGRILAITALTGMSVLPITEMFSRQFRFAGVPGSTVFVQHLTLWIAFIGAALAAHSDRLLALSANTFLPERWVGGVRLFVSAVGGAIALCLAWASFQFVNAERLSGGILAVGIPRWVAQAMMPAGFLTVAVGILWHTDWKFI